MKKIGCVGHDCAACATREKHINKLKLDVERWKSRATTYKKQRDDLIAAIQKHQAFTRYSETSARLAAEDRELYAALER